VVGEGKHLKIQLNAIAQLVSDSAAMDNPLRNRSNQARVTTVNFTESKQSFTQQIQQLKDCLKQNLETTLSEQETSLSLEEWVNSLAIELHQFEGNIEGNNLKQSLTNYPSFVTF